VTILQQNYFTFQEQIYQTDKEIVMGSPISGTIAEIFLQHLEHIHIRPPLDSKRILFNARYIDDSFIIYDTESTKQDTLIKYINSTHDSLQFNPTQESSDCINLLDLTIIRRISHLEIGIYRKPTKIDTTKHFFYPTTLTNTNWQHTDITLRECLISRLMQNAKKENGSQSPA